MYGKISENNDNTFEHLCICTRPSALYKCIHIMYNELNTIAKYIICTLNSTLPLSMIAQVFKVKQYNMPSYEQQE